MKLDFIAELWDVLSNHMDQSERFDAAETLVNFLIDHDYESTDIKAEFQGDKDISKALKYYIEQHEVEEEYYDDLDENQDDDDN